ncbi:MAG: hypothetical protein HF973_06110 [Chloroflexi bacterium]|nr:hypothetical protein [Chloroflexota bacterium]
MSTSFWISLATAVTTGIFAFLVLARYWVRRRWHLLAWGIGLVLYSVSSLAQAILFNQFNEFLFKLWYWAGAVAVAPCLGQGTLFLLARTKKWTWISFWIITALSLISLPLIFSAELNPAAYQPGIDLTEQFQEIFTVTGAAKTIRIILVIVLNTYGTILLVGGAIYSAFIFWRKRVLPHRMWGNVLIAIGGLLPAMGGFLILLGSPDFKYLGQLLGGILLFAGFLVATKGEPVP